jgi:hypothetical protein
MYNKLNNGLLNLSQIIEIVKKIKNNYGSS